MKSTTPRTGRYLGFALMEGGRVKIPSTLDLFVIQDETGEYPSDRAILKLELGGFGSREYITQYYPSVSYSWDNNEIKLAGNNQKEIQDITISEGKVVEVSSGSGKDKKKILTISGKFRTAKGEMVGEIELVWQNPESFSPQFIDMLYPDIPITPTLTGEYVGQCRINGANVERVLQIEATKLNGIDEEGDPNPFLGYEIKGRIAALDKTSKPNPLLIVSELFPSGAYNFYRGEVRLFPNPMKPGGKVTACQVGNNGLTCGDCLYMKKTFLKDNAVDRQASYQLFPRLYHLSIPDDEPLSDYPSGKDVKGKYWGYLHHEQSDRYQLLQIDAADITNTAHTHNLEEIYVSLTAQLYFGDKEDGEYLTYNFHQRDFPSMIPFSFAGNSDVLLTVTSWQKKTIKGTWFSRNFGKVGTFELAKDIIPPIDSSALKVEKLSGSYLDQSSYWELDLNVTNKESPENVNLFPKAIIGNIQGNNLLTLINGSVINISRPISFENVSYDFYANFLSMTLHGEINGKEQEWSILGEVDGKQLKLFGPAAYSFGVKMESQVLKTFLPMDQMK